MPQESDMPEEPQSRVEDILIGGATEPQSRVEKLLKDLIDGGGVLAVRFDVDYDGDNPYVVMCYKTVLEILNATSNDQLVFGYIHWSGFSRTYLNLTAVNADEYGVSIMFSGNNILIEPINHDMSVSTMSIEIIAENPEEPQYYVTEKECVISYQAPDSGGGGLTNT